MNHRIIDVALAVIKDTQGRYLVAQRPATTDCAGYWEFPGGKRETDEDRLQALRRECHEELGIVVEHARPLFCWNYQYNDRHVRLDAWLIDSYRGKARGAEGQTVRWLYPSEFDRYRFLEANKVLMKVLALPEVCAITPEIGASDNFYLKLDNLMSQNIHLLQFRAKNLSPIEYKEHALNIVRRGAEHNVMIILNAEPAWVATLSDVGLHLTSQGLMNLGSRPIAENRWLSASCHSAEELAHAEHIGVDFVFLSPVLPTRSHPDALTLGWDGLEKLVSRANIPIYALGGMNQAHLRQAQQIGCQGIAGISGFWDQEVG